MGLLGVSISLFDLVVGEPGGLEDRRQVCCSISPPLPPQSPAEWTVKSGEASRLLLFPSILGLLGSRNLELVTWVPRGLTLSTLKEPRNQNRTWNCCWKRCGREERARKRPQLPETSPPVNQSFPAVNPHLTPCRAVPHPTNGPLSSLDNAEHWDGASRFPRLQPLPSSSTLGPRVVRFRPRQSLATRSATLFSRFFPLLRLPPDPAVPPEPAEMAGRDGGKRGMLLSSDHERTIKTNKQLSNSSINSGHGAIAWCRWLAGRWAMDEQRRPPNADKGSSGLQGSAAQ